jgi:hypothetical protein
VLEIEALVERWQPTSRTRLLMDADQVARDPRLALVGKDVGQRGGLRIFPRGGGAPATPEERFAERYRRARGSVDVSPSRMQEAAFARVHMVDLIQVGHALEAGSAQHSRLRDIPPGTRVQLMTRILERMEEMSDDLLRVGTAEGRTRKGMEWEMERIRAFLSPDVLEDMAQAIVKRRWDDGTRMFMEGLGTVAVMVPSLGSLSRAMLSLGSSLMTGNFTFVSAPTAVPATTMMALRAADEVMREKGVQALAAVVPDDASHLMGIVSESPRVEGLVMFEEGEAALDAAAQATALGKAVVGAWETSEVAIVWDGVDVTSAAEEIVRSRFTDSGSLPSSIGKVGRLRHRHAHLERASRGSGAPRLHHQGCQGGPGDLVPAPEAGQGLDLGHLPGRQGPPGGRHEGPWHRVLRRAARRHREGHGTGRRLGSDGAGGAALLQDLAGPGGSVATMRWATNTVK